MLNGLDIVFLLKLSLKSDPKVRSKDLAEELGVTPVEISLSLKRCIAASLVHLSDMGKLLNRAGLLEFLTHGLRYVFPAKRGALMRGIPTGASAEPLNSQFQPSGDPPLIWPYKDGTVRGTALTPIHKKVPVAALRDEKLYELLALVDAIRGERVRERQLAIEELRKRLVGHG